VFRESSRWLREPPRKRKVYGRGRVQVLCAMLTELVGKFLAQTFWRFAIMEFVTEYTTPNDMLIEITNRCNYQCNFCTHSKMNHHFGDIDPEFLKRILREAYDMGVRRVGLYTIGEMFLCKDIVTHIKNAKETGYEYIYADTNGALADKNNLEAVITAGLDSIKFSINAGKAETYKIIHGHDKFENLL
jgi:MoaA/NifB/PqqE/SkfB family radical SAM enzyme